MDGINLILELYQQLPAASSGFAKCYLKFLISKLGF